MIGNLQLLIPHWPSLAERLCAICAGVGVGSLETRSDWISLKLGVKSFTTILDGNNWGYLPVVITRYQRTISLISVAIIVAVIR